MRFALGDRLTKLAKNFLNTCPQIDKPWTDQFLSLDYDEALWKCQHVNSSPLFGDSEIYFRHQEGMLFIPLAKKRIHELQFFNELDSRLRWGSGKPATQVDLEVFSGYYLLTLMGEKAFEVDCFSYGFTSFEEFVFTVSAVCANLCESKKNVSAYSWSSICEGRELVNAFVRNVNGDLRFQQTDMTPRTDVSPWGDLVSFSYADRNASLAAYHSVECRLLAITMRYKIDAGKDPLIENYEEMLKTVQNSQGLHGHFADIGNKSYFPEVALLGIRIPNHNDLEKPNPHSLPKEFTGEEVATIKNGNLFFSPSGVRFCPNDIPHLVRGIHDYCHHGFGRTSLEDLIGFYSRAVEHLNGVTEPAEIEPPSVWVVYLNSADSQNPYLARRFQPDRRTSAEFTAPTLEKVRHWIREEALRFNRGAPFLVPRSADDDELLVESWL